MWAIVAFLGVVYLLIFVKVWRERQKILASHSWPQVMGTITSVRDAVSRRTKSTTYIVDLEYRYEVNGVVYTGTRLGLTPVRHPHREDAHAEAARYPAQSTVNVYYDPKNPAKAILTLEPPRWRPIIVILAMFGCLLLVCLMAAFLHYGPKSHF